MQLHLENCDMDLSVKNRSMDNTSKDNDHKEREKVLLAQLKAKIELRKKQRRKENIVSENHTDTEASKQEKVEDEPTTENVKETEIINDEKPIDNIKQVSNETGHKKKRKKKRKLPSSDEDEDEVVPPQPQTDIVPGKGFTILGVDHFEKKQKVKRVLPHWLANPSVVSVNLQHLTTTVDEMAGIDPDLVQKLKDNNITHFFPVQCQVIPWLLSTLNKPTKYWPRDVCVSAPTGSGKTLAYVIPVIQALKCRVVPRIRALVVLPVQDLAVQVLKVFETYCVGTDLKVTLITGKENFREEQRQLIRTGLVSGPQSLVDIVITTTGRIVDHIKSTPGFSLQHLRFLIIDEADRIMENIKNDWLHHLNKHIQSFSGQTGVPRLNVANLKSIPPPPQKLLFSATLSQDPEKLQQLGLFQPKLFTSVVEGHEMSMADPEGRGDFVGKYTTPAELGEMVCAVTPTNKPLVLHHMMSVNKFRHVLCFTDTQQEAHRLAILLTHLAQGQFRVSEISAALGSNERKDILAKFKDEEIDILVSTNALARGIDIPIVDYVISYSAPKYIKNYIHRIGRTGRAGRKGTAITFVLDKEKDHFKHMVKSAGKNTVEELFITDAQLDPYLDDYQQAIEDMRLDLEQEQSETIKVSKEEKRSRKPKRKKKQHIYGSKMAKV